MTRARGLAVYAVGALAAAAASWGRALVAGTLRVDGVLSLPAQLAFETAAGLALVPSVVAHLRLPVDLPERAQRTLLRAAVVAHLIAALALPLTSNDLFSNLAYGRLAALGLSPYLHAPDALPPGEVLRGLVGDRWLHTPIAYGPLLAHLAHLAGLPSALWAEVAIYKALLVAGVLGTLALAFDFARGRDGAAGRFALLALSPLLLWEVSGQAHNDGAMVAATMLFVWAASRDRDLLASAALSCALWTKFAVAPLGLFYFLYLVRRSPARAARGAAIAIAVSALLWSPFLVAGGGAKLLAGPLATAGGDTARHTRSIASVSILVARLALPAAERPLFRIFQLASAALVLAAFVRGCLRSRSLPELLRSSLLVLWVYQLTTPWYLPWYTTWLLPLAIADDDPEIRRLVALHAGLALMQYACPIEPVSSAAIDLLIGWRLWRLRGRFA